MISFTEMPLAVQLENIILKDQNQPILGKKLSQLVYLAFFNYHLKSVQIRGRTLNRLINRKDKDGQFLFQKFLKDKNFENFQGKTLSEFTEFTGYSLIFWAGAHYTNSTVQAAEIKAEFSVRNLHILVPADYRNRITGNFEIEKLPKLAIIQNIEAFEEVVAASNPNKPFSELVAEKSDKSIGHVEYLLSNHFPNGVPFRKERQFSELFGFGFQITGPIDDQSNLHNPLRSVEVYKESFCNEFLNLEIVGPWQNSNKIQATDLFRLSSKGVMYSCPNPWCQIPSHPRKDFIDEHVKTCTNLTKFSYKARKMTAKLNSVREFLAENDFLDINYVNTDCAFTDIETFGTQDNVRDSSRNTVELAEHKVVTIAFSSTFSQDKLIKRDDLSYEGYFKFYSEVCNYVVRLGREYERTLPPQIFESFRKISAILSEDDKKCQNSEVPSGERLDPHLKSMLSKGRKYLKKLMTLKIYGFNSERFDFPIMLPGLLTIWKLKPKDVKVVRRTAGLMKMAFNISGQEIAFLDARNYVASGSLGQFAKTFGAQDSKGTFCYEYFNSIQDAIDCTEWPTYDNFRSSLRYPNEKDLDSRIRKAYELARNELDLTADQFLNKMAIPSNCYELGPDPFCLPDTINFTDSNLHLTLDPILYIQNFVEYRRLYDAGIISNMYDFLGWYNIQDTVILKQALNSYVNVFVQNLKVNPLEFTTLPAMSESIMWSFFSESVGSAFSLAEREINTLVRSKNTGGLTLVTDTRHQEVNVDPPDRVYQEQVYTTPNGEKIVKIKSEDYNNLYGCAMRDPMPVGKGILYKKKENGKFSWNPVKSSDKYSLDAIAWINYKQGQFLKPDGTRHVIRHALNFGEVEIKAGSYRTESNLVKYKIYKPDGYVVIDDVEHFFEFDGCHHHECPHKCSTYQRFKNRTRDDRWSPRAVTERNAFYETRGVLHTITSCQWYRQRNNLSFKNYTSAFFRQTDITEQQILSKVESNEFFGLILCDVQSPPEVVERFSRIKFPPVVKTLSCDESMVHPAYVETLKKNNREFPLDPVLTLGFHGKELLLTTEFIKFYLKIGIRISNIALAIEYEQDRALADFVNHVTNERKKATEANNNALQNIYKLVMNSSYG